MRALRIAFGLVPLALAIVVVVSCAVDHPPETVLQSGSPPAAATPSAGIPTVAPSPVTSPSILASAAPTVPPIPPTSAAPSTFPVPTVAPSPPIASVSPSQGARVPTLQELVGQKLVVRMTGLTPSPGLLGRIRRGEVGGVILFRANFTNQSGLFALTRKLQDAAAAGGQPALLIAVDQEGGEIERISWAPPTRSAVQLGDDGRPDVAFAEGVSTGEALRTLGINVDFAPVADVPESTASFMFVAGRTFSFSATVTSSLANSFATGLVSTGVAPTMKHFPGLGLATHNTDTNVVTITASRAGLDAGLLPYRVAIAHGIPLIMLSNATYPAFDADNAAGWSQAISTALLRGELGFTGVTITDSLDGTGHARGLATRLLAIRAAVAGTDMLLVTGSEATSQVVYETLLRKAREGAIPRVTLRASYDRIIALKSRL